jgi:hypothetical protein
LQNDLEKVKWRMLEVVEENRALHEELKRSVVDEIMHANVGSLPASVLPSSSLPVPLLMNAPKTNQHLTHFDHEKWRTELVGCTEFAPYFSTSILRFYAAVIR